MRVNQPTPQRRTQHPTHAGEGLLRRTATRLGLAALIITPLLTACPATTQTPKVTSITATPDHITTFNQPFTITWTTTGTTAAHICRLGIRPAQAGDEDIVPIGNFACTDTTQHTPTEQGDFNYVLTIHQGTNQPAITKATSNTITRTIPSLGDTIWTRQFGTNAGGTDAFVRKYDPNGNTLWTRQFGTNKSDQATRVTTDPTGNIIITGYTEGSLEGTNAGSWDVYVRKYGPNGDTLWTRQFGTNAYDYAASVTTDAAGNIFITGYTRGSLDGTNAGDADAFVRKYDPNGTTIGTSQIGTNGADIAWGVNTDSAGNIIITGYTTGSIEGTNAGGMDVFLRKFDTNGGVLWTRQFGTTTPDSAWSVAIDAADSIIITGNTEGSLEGTNAGSSDVFVRKYDTNGLVLWTRQFGTAAYDRAFDATTDAAGNIVIAGYTEGAIEGTNAGGTDAFVRKFTP